MSRPVEVVIREFVIDGFPREEAGRIVESVRARIAAELGPGAPAGPERAAPGPIVVPLSSTGRGGAAAIGRAVAGAVRASTGGRA